jgi:dTMP kinase
MTRPRFITLEGGEGVGKSTQARLLAEALRGRGKDVLETREPGGSPGAEAIRSLLMTGAIDRWTPQTEALLFAAARADHVARTIRPALAEGAWVICDRYLDSSLAYQGGADGMGGDAIRALHDIGSGGLLPDRTLLLDLPAGTAAGREFERDQGNTDRFSIRGSEFRNAVFDSFRNLAKNEQDRFRIVDARGTADDVTGRLIAALEDLL